MQRVPNRLAFEQCNAACAKAIRPRQGDAAPAARATTGSLGLDRTSKSSPARIVEDASFGNVLDLLPLFFFLAFVGGYKQTV